MVAGCGLVGPGEDIDVGKSAATSTCRETEPYWPFEEGAGPRTRDASPAKNDLSLVNNAAFSFEVPEMLAATSKHSMQLTPTGYLLADQDLATWLAGDASVSFWIQLRSLPSALDPGRSVLFGWKWLVSWGAVWWDGEMGVLTDGDNRAIGPFKLDAGGTWHHVAQSRESASAELRVYIDGKLGTPTRGGLLGAAQDSIREIGRGAPEVVVGLDALIDDLRLFSRVISPDEVEQLAAGRTPSGSELCAPVITGQRD